MTSKIGNNLTNTAEKYHFLFPFFFFFFSLREDLHLKEMKLLKENCNTVKKSSQQSHRGDFLRY